MERSNHLHVDVQRQRLVKKGNKEVCLANSSDGAAYAAKDQEDIGHSSDVERQKHAMERTFTNQKCVVPRSFDKQRRWKNVDPLQRGPSDGRAVIPQ